MLQLRLLGGVDLRDEQGRELRAVLAQPKRLALFIYLALARPPGFHRRDTLLALFWPDLNQTRARAALRKAVMVVRRGLGPAAEALVGRGDEELGLADGTVDCDAIAFERAAAAGQHAKALDLYRGDLLEGFFITGAAEFERWAERERARLREEAATAAWALADAAAAERHDQEAVRRARQALAFTPTDESAVRRLIALCNRASDRAAALRAYDEFAVRLWQEHGVRPSAETRRLIEVLRQSGELPRAAGGKPE